MSAEKLFHGNEYHINIGLLDVDITQGYHYGTSSETLQCMILLLSVHLQHLDLTMASLRKRNALAWNGNTDQKPLSLYIQ